MIWHVLYLYYFMLNKSCLSLSLSLPVKFQTDCKRLKPDRAAYTSRDLAQWLEIQVSVASTINKEGILWMLLLTINKQDIF